MAAMWHAIAHGNELQLSPRAVWRARDRSPLTVFCSSGHPIAIATVVEVDIVLLNGAYSRRAVS